MILRIYFNFFSRLPEEGPMPQPAVGMRLSKWPDTARYLLAYDMMIFLFFFLPNSFSQSFVRNPNDELRTEEHNTFRP